MSTFEEKTSIIELAGPNKATSGSRSACFIVIAGSEVGRMYKLEGNELIVGRVGEVGIEIHDNGVSRRHAKITRSSDGNVAIADLNSTNGTFCNGERIERRVLQDGDKIQIGTTTILKFSFQDYLEEDFQRRQYESATRDPLTHCYNKKYFFERLPGDLAFARRHGGTVSIAMVDIDHFKKVNDTHGHLAGDHILRAVAKTIQEAIRADDVLARYGGEEFAIIMRNIPPNEAVVAVERVRQKVAAATFTFEDKPIQVTISVGVSSSTRAGNEVLDNLIRSADEFLYDAKRNGRNRVVGPGSSL